MKRIIGLQEVIDIFDNAREKQPDKQIPNLTRHEQYLVEQYIRSLDKRITINNIKEQNNGT